VSKSVKHLINQRNISFMQGDAIAYNNLQKQVKRELKQAKLKYKDKVESHLSSGQSRPAWDGVKSMMGLQSNKYKTLSFDGKTESDLADVLNIFYNRFNIYDFTKELSVFKEPWVEQNVAIKIDKDRVKKILRGVKERKSPGPDNIGGRLIKSCAEPLSDILAFIFNKSLQLHRVPHLWKESVIVPVPKINVPKSLNDFRPVALTSLIMKSFEKIIKQEIIAMTKSQLDPLQFAYRAGRGVEDALGSLLNTVFNQ